MANRRGRPSGARLVVEVYAQRVAAYESQRDVARRAELSPGFLSDLVHGRRGADPATASRLARALDVDVDELFTIAPTAAQSEPTPTRPSGAAIGPSGVDRGCRRVVEWEPVKGPPWPSPLAPRTWAIDSDVFRAAVKQQQTSPRQVARWAGIGSSHMYAIVNHRSRAGKAVVYSLAAVLRTPACALFPNFPACADGRCHIVDVR